MLGSILGHYRIDREIGSGGMGQVYAAEDLKLRRQVALKVLSASFGADDERRHRFAREAQAVAALNHPNIVTVYSVEQSGELHFLTMEMVPGQPLSQLIPQGGMPLGRLLKLAIPLADAVSAAHQKGITHRDLKPANIMVGDDGRLKVLDFGLAKLKEEHQGAAGATALPTQTGTAEGRILGTVAYMSPEQAEGRPVDHRSDIFSLGIVLYELATGERPFRGDTSLSVLSSILKDTPRSITDINRALPRDLARIVRRCLMKDPEERYQSAKDVRNDLQELKQAVDSGEVAPGGVPLPTAVGNRGRRTPLIVGAAAVVVVAGLAAGRFGLGLGRSLAAPALSSVTQLTVQQGIEEFPSLSPDGKWLVYASDASGNFDIYLQSVGGQTPINLTKDSTADDLQPAFSPDGERIAFRSDREGGGIFVMGRTGEAVRRITDGGYNPAWSATANEIVFATENVVTRPGARGRRSGLWIANVASGDRRQIVSDDAVQPSWSPQGTRIAYWAARGPQRQRDILSVAAAGGEPVLVTDDEAIDWNPVWSPDGRYLYFSSERGGSMNLWRVPIDERSGRPLGPPEPVTVPSQFVAHVSLSADGHRLAWTSVEFENNVQRLAFDPVNEKVEGEPHWVTSGSKLWGAVDVSHDGEWIVMTSGRPQEDLFVARADGTGLRQLTNDGAFDRFPRWSPDGRRIVFQSNRSGGWEAWTIVPDGSSLTQVTRNMSAHYPLWSPDGSRIAVNEIVDAARVSIVDLGKAGEAPARLPDPPGEGWSANSWSPDGSFLAGAEARSGVSVGVLVYALESGTFTKLTDIGREPFWLGDNRRVIYMQSPETVAVVDRVSRNVREILSRPRQSLALHAVSRDGRQLYLVSSARRGDIWMAALN